MSGKNEIGRVYRLGNGGIAVYLPHDVTCQDTFPFKAGDKVRVRIVEGKLVVEALDLFYTVIFLEELQKVKSSGFAAAMWAHAYLAMTHLNAEGDERIKKDYLAPSIAGKKIGALCITEPFGGSDVAGMRTNAVRNGNKFVINGSKTFITNGVYADYYVVAAKTSPELDRKSVV